MANPKNIKGKPSPNRGGQKTPVYSSAARPSTLFERLNKWFDGRANILTIVILSLSFLFSLLLFQARMDIGGDDSAYLERAFNFVHKGEFPIFQGPLYPLVLSMFVAPFGINIVLLKFLSIVFNIVGLWFFYKAFYKRLPSFVFYPVFFIAAINSYILNFASLTYNEAFFTMLQYIFFFIFFKLIDSGETTDLAGNIKESFKLWLPSGLLIFMLILTRNIAFVCLGGLVLYLVINKQYKHVLYLVGAFLVFQLPMMALEKTVFHVQNQWQSQGELLLLKNPYNKAEGYENFSGFVNRFFENCGIYLSKRFMQIIGFRSADSTDSIGGITFILASVILLSFYRIIKSGNKYLLAVCLYTVSILAGTFFSLQTRWDQPRMVMVYVPLLLMILFYGLYDLFKKMWAGQLVLLLLILSVGIAGIANTLNKTKKNMPIISKNMHGDMLAGYTPDWVNYLKASKWCADSLPKGSLVLARKSAMSFIYSNGTEFFPIYNQFSNNADTILDFYKKNNVTYILAAQIRLNPDVNDGNFINTIQQTFGYVSQKYPKKLKFIHQEGTSESAQVWQIMYNN